MKKSLLDVHAQPVTCMMLIVLPPAPLNHRRRKVKGTFYFISLIIAEESPVAPLLAVAWRFFPKPSRFGGTAQFPSVSSSHKICVLESHQSSSAIHPCSRGALTGEVAWVDVMYI